MGKLAPETQKLNWKLNQSPATIEDKEALGKLLTTPPIRKIDLKWPLGLEVTARNKMGVTIKDACDAIYKQFKKKADDELEKPYLAGFEWDREECYTKFIVHQKSRARHQLAAAPRRRRTRARRHKPAERQIRVRGSLWPPLVSARKILGHRTIVSTVPVRDR